MQTAEQRTGPCQQSSKDNPHDKECVHEEHESGKHRIETIGDGNCTHV